MADRSTLHLSKIEAFAAYCAQDGWVRQPTRGQYEVLRMKHPLFVHPFIAYTRADATEHASIPLALDGSSRFARMVRNFIRYSRSEVPLD